MAFKDIYIKDCFSSIVDDMRPNGVISSFVASGSNYEITNNVRFDMSSFLLKAGYYVDLYDSLGAKLYSDCRIISVNLTSRKFVVNVPETVTESPISWKCQAPYFEHGHILEVSNTLSEKSKGQKLKFQKYPLIVLVQDVEKADGTDKDTDSEINAQLFIADLTDPNYKADKRYEMTFKPVLYPLYNSFCHALHYSRFFKTYSPETIRKTVIDRLYWGKNAEFANRANIFGDWLDAIEISKLNLKTETQNNIPLNQLITNKN